MDIASLDHIDFYVSIVDNYGDMGFAVNFALSLRARHPHLVIRFFSDDEALFAKFFHGSTPKWITYHSLEILSNENPPVPSRLICNFFDYKFPRDYLARFSHPKTIVSFSYFLLHRGLESLHGTNYFLNDHDRIIHFVPSLLPGGGGIIINPKIEERREKFLKNDIEEGRGSFLKEIFGMENTARLLQKKWVSVFVYPQTLENMRSVFKLYPDIVFWVAENNIDLSSYPQVRRFPFLSIENYGVLLDLCDANVVRGENSLCQALLAGRPLLWDIYKESNGAHTEKTEGFIAYMMDAWMDQWYDEMARAFMNGDTDSLQWFIGGIQILATGFEKISHTVHEMDMIARFEGMLEDI